jgi:DNA-binding MarR family transcriptional regulator
MSGAVDPYALAVAPTGARLSEGLDQPARQNAKGLSRSIKLTETQLMMLSAAAQRNDRHLIAAPNLKGAAAQKIARKLIDAGLVREVRAKAGAPVWRRDGDAGFSYALRLTTAGTNAIAIDKRSESGLVRDDGDLRGNVAPARSSSEEGPASHPLSAEENGHASQRSSFPRGGTKLAQVVASLQQDRGASIAELIVLTGWLPHTTRAALTGLRKRGFVTAIDRSDKERGSVYRVERNPIAEVSAATHFGVPQAHVVSSSKTMRGAAKPKARQAG